MIKKDTAVSVQIWKEVSPGDKARCLFEYLGKEQWKSTARALVRRTTGKMRTGHRSGGERVEPHVREERGRDAETVGSAHHWGHVRNVLPEKET